MEVIPGVPQPAWNNRKRWANLLDGTRCPLCREVGPPDLIAETTSAWVTAPKSAPLPGYVCVIAKRHVVEPFELPAPERAAFWEDAMTAARALSGLLRPVKMNYEVHGNTIPHLHLHLFPRFRGDPYEGGPIDPRRASFHRSPLQIRRIRDALADASPRGGRRSIARHRSRDAK